MLFAKDNQGNRVYRYLILDPDAPTVTFATRPAATNGDVDVTITALDTGAGVKSVTPTCTAGTATCEVVGDFTVAADGTATLIVRSTGDNDTTISATATDNVGNTFTSPPSLIDRTAPVISFATSPAAGGRIGVDVTITATDTGGSGVRSITQNCTSCTTFTAPGDGPGTLRVNYPGTTDITLTATATDNAGNTSQASTLIDRTAPVISFATSPAAGGRIGVDVTITATDTGGSGVRSITQNCTSCTTFTAPGDGPGTLRVNYPGTTDITLTATATDNAGNTSQASTLIDRTAPVISFATSPAAGGRIGVDVTITATDTGGSGVRSITQNCTSCTTFTAPGDGPGTLRINYPGTTDTTLTATATDNAGNTSQASTLIDRTPPTATLTVEPRRPTSAATAVPAAPR